MIKKIFFYTIALFLFSLNSGAQSISMIGDAVSGWSTDVAMSTTDNVNYTLSNFTFSNGGAKFRQDSSWNTNWGSNSFPSGTAYSNGSNIPVTAGIYNVAFNRNTGVYSFTTVSTGFDAISISGTAGPGSNQDVSMYTVDGVNYSLDNYTLTTGSLIFRKDNSSSTTWASSSFPSGTAIQGGSPISVTTAGTYDIKFNKTTGAYSFSFAKIGIIGSATSGGWDTDTLMSTTDGVNYLLSGVTLTSGELKFRQNQTWAVNWGSNSFPNGTATLNGNNISITAGTYSITFNRNTGAFYFRAGYPIVTLYTSGGSELELITLNGTNYYLNNATVSTGNYVFRQDNSNSVTWGANAFPTGTATQGGASIPVVGGDYNITFNKSTGEFSFNYLVISVIGSATAGGWSTDTNLSTTDGVNYKLSGLTLTTGDIKFRQGNDWSVNWGGNVFPGGTAYLNSSNIGVTSASNFTVTFNRTTGAYYFYDEVNLQVASPVNLCKGTVATSLTNYVYNVPGSTLKWYTNSSTTSIPRYMLISTGAPTPTTSAVGTKTYYVSQTINGVEGAKVAVVVNVLAIPTTPTTLTGTAAVGPLVGTTTSAIFNTTAVSGATSYLWTVPAGVTIVSGQGTTSVEVNFNNVAAGAGAVGSISVKSVNDNGCTSAAKSLALTKALPAAPASIKMTEGSGTTAITSFAKYMGTNKVLTLTAATVVAATSYEWELPEGVNQLSGGNTNVITVNFLGVTSSNTYNNSTAAVLTNVLRIGVKSKNGVGVSTTNNSALVNPTTTSTAKLLTLTAVKPAVVSAVAGQIAGLCGGSTYTYTITDTALASSYTVTAPAGATVNFINTLTFTVTYPAGFVINTSTSTANKSLVVTSVNGMGSSATSKTLTLSTAMAAVKAINGGTTYSSCDQTFYVDAIPGATSYTWTVPTGASIVSGQGTNSVVVNYGLLTGNQTIKVYATNACGVSSMVKSVTLTFSTCSIFKPANVSAISEMNMYPNPASQEFNIELNSATEGQLEMTLFSMNGAVIRTKNIPLNEGPNVINENISELASGIYFIKLTNQSNNETVTKKLIKQ